MRYLLSVPPFTDPAVVVDLARTAEASGWDGFFLWDHLRWDDVQDVHDPWVLLGAIAQVTERMLLGTMVTPLSRRRPWVVAKHLVTLDHLSGGRAVLGVGLGEPPDVDFGDFGDEADARVRAAILDEALDVVAGLVGDGRVDARRQPPPGGRDHAAAARAAAPRADLGGRRRPEPSPAGAGPPLGRVRADRARPRARRARGVRRRAPAAGLGPGRAVGRRRAGRRVRRRRRHLAGAVRVAEGRGVGAGSSRTSPRRAPPR